MFKDKVLMITGGTGSFGSTVLKKFLDSDLSGTFFPIGASYIPETLCGEVVICDIITVCRNLLKTA